MANAILTPSVLAKEALVQLENSLVLSRRVFRDYSEEFVKVGDTITIRKPVRYSVTSGPTMSVQDTEEGSTTVVINQQRHVDIAFSANDLTLKIEDMRDRYIIPAMMELAQTIESDVANCALNTWNWVGTPGNTVNSYPSFARAPQRMDELAMPTQRTGMLAPADWYAMNGGIVGGGSNASVFKESRVGDALAKAALGEVAGVDTFMCQSIANLTTGARGGTPVVSGSGQTSIWANVKATGSQTLNISGASNSVAGWAKAGDVFTIAGVYALQPRTRAQLPFLQQFVVNSDAASDGSGLVALNISPALVIAGPYRNVSAAPANGAALTFMGTANTTYPQNFVFTKQSIALVSRPLAYLPGLAEQARETYKGISMRVMPAPDPVNDTGRWRFDVLYGVKAIYPETMTRLSG